MDFRQLRQFVQLAETLHFGRASAASHVSASALSRSIRQLESVAGATLFHRDNRTVALTRQGETFLRWAREVLAGWDEVRHRLLEQSGILQGEVSLYCSVTASYSFLFELLSRLRRDHPQIEIKLHTGDPEDAIARVLGGHEDIAIGARPDALPAGLAFKPITRSRLVFIAPAGKALQPGLQRRRPDPATWAATPMILAESGLSRQRVERWFRELGVAPRIYAQVAGNEAIVSMVSLGFGIGVVPQIVLDNSPLAAQVAVLGVRPALLPFEVGLFTLEKQLRNPLVAAFWKVQVAGARRAPD
ncbi:MAG: transcriptional regulator IlvY [Gammaproteobacteria bacterium]|nr:MAG: HTH-type transcriptional activator IlvY [Pseudomonadota bacterium]MBC6944879.1 HTH-type transcriptional activator IlvY [Gammaproteobacteria bacterium]MCE7895779.1 HTH-type transcriptional activator IlvY [Gammaproteobacteria bacterium PRO8]MDL1879689.1 HTH-type transcriptional activator IlvY [Gammaproteobacteria bacterium PRO2]MCQ3933648.1 HTH-type transcriptional activator IlvY [Gammaproteobacteria bacterium]